MAFNLFQPCNVPKKTALVYKIFFIFLSTVKAVYNDHFWDQKIVAVVDRWSLFRGHLCNKSSKWDLKMEMVASSGSTVK